MRKKIIAYCSGPWWWYWLCFFIIIIHAITIKESNAFIIIPVSSGPPPPPLCSNTIRIPIIATTKQQPDGTYLKYQQHRRPTATIAVSSLSASGRNHDSNSSDDDDDTVSDRLLVIKQIFGLTYYGRRRKRHQVHSLKKRMARAFQNWFGGIVFVETNFVNIIIKRNVWVAFYVKFLFAILLGFVYLVSSSSLLSLPWIYPIFMVLLTNIFEMFNNANILYMVFNILILALPIIVLAGCNSAFIIGKAMFTWWISSCLQHFEQRKWLSPSLFGGYVYSDPTYIAIIIYGPLAEEVLWRFLPDLYRRFWTTRIRRREEQKKKNKSTTTSTTASPPPPKAAADGAPPRFILGIDLSQYETWEIAASALFAVAHISNWLQYQIPGGVGVGVSHHQSLWGDSSITTMSSDAFLMSIQQTVGAFLMSLLIFVPAYRRYGLAGSFGAHMAWNALVVALNVLLPGDVFTDRLVALITKFLKLQH